MADRPSRRTVLVTGATSGIGRAISQRLCADGHRVVGIGRDFSQQDLGPPAFTAAPCDLSDLDALPGLLAELVRQHPTVDALVLSAGRGLFGGLEEFSPTQIRALIDLNFTSQVLVARACLPTLKQRGWGDLVIIGSEAALAGRRQGSLYCASKFALRGFAQALREDCAKSGVRVSSIHPGMVKTRFFADLDFTPGDAEENHLQPEEVAAAVAFVLAQRPGAVIDEICLSPLTRVVKKRRPS